MIQAQLGFQTGVKIDWLTAHLTPNQWFSWWGDATFDWHPGKPRWGYSRALEDRATGTVLMMGTYEDKTASLLVASGQALDNLRVAWKVRGEPEFVARITALTDRATRVDLAIDVADGGFGIGVLAETVGSGGFGRRGRREMMIKSAHAEHGELLTVYSGKRPSRIVYRGYQKPMSGGVLVSRHEVELHGDTARVTWDKLWAGDGAALIEWSHKTVMEVIHPDYQHVVPGLDAWEFSRMPAVRRSPKMRRKEWLERQVLPVLVSDFEDSADDEEALIEWLCREIAERSKGRIEA